MAAGRKLGGNVAGLMIRRGTGDAARPKPIAPRGTLRLGDMPRPFEEAVTGYVTGLLVVLPRVERFAFIGPLLGTVSALDQAVLAFRLGAGRSHQRRPIGGAWPVAG
jgi:hypothetical protein